MKDFFLPGSFQNIKTLKCFTLYQQDSNLTCANSIHEGLMSNAILVIYAYKHLLKWQLLHKPVTHFVLYKNKVLQDLIFLSIIQINELYLPFTKKYS